ncbi:MAG: hypothetical protein IPH28_01880 [Cytophagaceae bacterium]|nr:hypothetical protein [Cytophagaceae bacterium]MBK9510136.1 hypothetical protein [Cytophagaceae bacterium]MBK9934840.1 hypothetical protein [Cytophagaceae bacterium]MBL0301278.1 hypothetical protein [Cytophagaceae bacterium]MBL0324095.1 hypothetical protein [Cytophagaceae bacterium]
MKTLIYTILFLNISTYVLGQSITLDPKTTQAAGIQVNSDLAFKKEKRETANGGWANYPRDNSSVLIFEGGGSLNGIADGQDGLIVYVFNGYPTGATTTGQLLLQHENASSTSSNRILTPNGTDFPVGNGGTALIYDSSKQRWRVATPEQLGSGGSFSGWGLSGNAGTNPSTNFIGTTDNTELNIRTNNVERVTVNSAGNVGIGSPSPTTKLEVTGDFRLNKKTTINTVGTQNALDRLGAPIIYFNTTGTVTLNGIAGGSDGMILYLYTSSSNTLILNNETSPAAFNDQIVTHTGGTLTITGRGGVTLLYENSGWRVIGYAE